MAWGTQLVPAARNPARAELLLPDDRLTTPDERDVVVYGGTPAGVAAAVAAAERGADVTLLTERKTVGAE
jgi:NADPH-dependent 2,4-dienoyl-CoA reductase/sulfur reductase-like enzyme